jgi:hypothetical protein
MVVVSGPELLGWITADEGEEEDQFAPSSRHSPATPPDHELTVTAGALALTDAPAASYAVALPSPQARGVRLPPIHNRTSKTALSLIDSITCRLLPSGNSSAVTVPWTLDYSGNAFPIPVSERYRTPRLRLDRSASPGEVNTAFEGDVFEEPEPSLFTPSRLKTN